MANEIQVQEQDTVGMNVRVARVRRDLSQAALAQKLGWSERRISLIEASPTVDLRLSDAIRLGYHLGLRPAYFLEAMESAMAPETDLVTDAPESAP